jgi:cytochrome c oxidase cbb3-type subunit 3
VGVALALLLVASAGCDREDREYTAHNRPPAPTPRTTALSPGGARPQVASNIGRHYEDNAYHITQGGRLYKWFNCNGCHAAGGGSIGPALMDDAWRYGGSIDQIHATILQGRPNGMPSFRGKIPDAQVWQIAAYVRAMSGNVRKDAAPSRRDGMQATPPLSQVPRQPPRATDAAGVQGTGR